MTLAFLIGLSLAITNAVFPPGRRAAAIAAYFGVGYAVATPLPALGGALAHAIGWRACFFVVPVIAALGLAITWRYVPETVRADRRLDVAGLALFAVALLGLIFGTSRMETGIDAVGVASIAVGLAAGCGFVMRELRTQDPALDMRVFRSSQFNAAVTAGRDVQHRARRVDGAAGLLPGHDPQGIARAVRLPADSRHRDGGSGGLLRRPGRQPVRYPHRARRRACRSCSPA